MAMPITADRIPFQICPVNSFREKPNPLILNSRKSFREISVRRLALFITSDTAKAPVRTEIMLKPASMERLPNVKRGE